jgi:quinoprotein glucose dehydrogenase
MSKFSTISRVWATACALIALNVSAAEPRKAAAASDEGELAIKKFKLAPGLKTELFAAEPLLANPVSFCLDERGRIYVTETYRLHKGVTDIRKHMNWLDEELAAKTTEDLVNLFKKYEVPGLTEQSERISLVEDRSGSGRADHATIFAEGFNTSVDGIGAGVLARKGNVWYANMPNLWLLRDNDGDGRTDGAGDVRKSLHYGYGVRVGFLGHDLHGLRLGPDGKLYFSVGDRGFNINVGGRNVAAPEMGAVLRCNQDGSDLEIFHSGLRNPQELCFDQYGNLFTGDNNSDGGDKARWVYLVEGGDSGWRVGWQFIEKPNARGPWNAEKMWHPQNDEQPAFLLPPIINIADGPSGVAYYPGIGLPERYREHFFLSDFRGASANSGIHTFALKPKGATFELVDHDRFMWNVLATDVDFGPDGAVYMSDWVEGWGLTGKGRIYRIFDETQRESELVKSTKKLIAEGMDQRKIPELTTLLAHPDQRVRQEAQFTLADRDASRELTAVALKKDHQLARLHAIWGLGQIAARHKAKSPKIAEATVSVLLPLLGDGDAEVRVQAAKVLGDARVAKAYDGLIKQLRDANARVQFHGAMGLAKLARKEAVKPVLEMLRENGDRDPYLRHAGVTALAATGDTKAILAAGKDASPAVRMAALLTLRRWQSAEVGMFLGDAEPRIVLEAARAINDTSIEGALPQLAALITQPGLSDPLIRRVLNANFRLGTAASAKALAEFAVRSQSSEARRVEALDELAEWKKPAGRDKVIGLWRPLRDREAKPAVDAVRPILAGLLRDTPDPVRIAAIRLTAQLAIAETGQLLFDLVSDPGLKSVVRVEALKALGALGSTKLQSAVNLALTTPDEALRSEAGRWQSKLNPEEAVRQLAMVLNSQKTAERQSAFVTLGTMKEAAADKVLAQWLDQLLAGKVPAELQLDLLDAARKRSAADVQAKLKQFESARPATDALAFYRETLTGGDAAEGKKIFFEKAEVSCLKCHQVNGVGAEVGPVLTGVGTRQTREYLLEALVNPNAKIAPGFDNVVVTMKNGVSYAGILKSETATELLLNSPEDGLLKLSKAEIDKRVRGLSGMPAELINALSKRDLRNLVEFLAGLK